MPIPDQAPYYRVDVYSTVQALGRVWLGVPLFRAPPTAGVVHRYSARAGQAAAAQQASTRATLAPSFMRHVRR